jgi:hypothetical protein
MRFVKIALVVSLLVNVTAVPYLTWKLVLFDLTYRRDVDYCAELAYGVGYYKAKGADMAAALGDYPTRLHITHIDQESLEVLIGKRQRLLLTLRDDICDALVTSQAE